MLATQSKALLIDAYRELNARKMFWITLILSGLVVAIFALLGINERGMVIAFWTIETPGITINEIPKAVFYKSLFTTLGISIWLTWIAAILALISTSTIFPDLVSAGSIDLILSKPIGRLRLFFTKYLFGLLFVTLQVSVFTVASFFVLGLRGGVWEPIIFVAIPIVVVFFSYLFAICATLGVITKSTIASLLLTILIWFLVFIMHSAEATVLSLKLMNEMQIEAKQAQIERTRDIIAGLESAEDPSERTDELIQQNRDELEELQTELAGSESSLNTITTIHKIAIGVKTIMPKTSETVDLIERYMIDIGEFEAMTEGSSGGSSDFEGVNTEELQLEAIAAIRERPVWWVVGTSLLFELVVLGFGAWRFSRRDF